MPFQFNVYSALLLLPFTQGLLFSLLLLSRSKDRYFRAHVMLSIVLLLLSVKVAFWMLGFAGWYDSHDTYTSFMFYFPFNPVCLMGPALYFYFLSVTNQNFKFEKRHLHHLWLPAAWFMLIIGKLAADYHIYYPFANKAIFQFGTKGPLAELDKSVPVTLIVYGSFLFYLWRTLQSYRTYRQYAEQHFSQLDKIDFKWLRNLLVAVGCSMLLMLLYQLLNWVHPLSYKADWYSYFFLGILIYYISIKGYQVQLAHKPALQYEPQHVKASTSPFTETSLPDLELWVERLSQLMEQEKPHLLPELTLNQLAKMMQVNTGLLSKIINTGFTLNFNDFVNGYRIGEVLTRFESKQHQTFTLLGIGLESGFNSKATFNRAFKKYTGTTPLAYLKDSECIQVIDIDADAAVVNE